MTPVRIQRQRTKGWRMPPNAVYVGRGSGFGNPFMVGVLGGYVRAEDAVLAYQRWLNGERADPEMAAPPTTEEIRRRLRGKNLACWCRPGDPCHADVLLRLAND